MLPVPSLKLWVMKMRINLAGWLHQTAQAAPNVLCLCSIWSCVAAGRKLSLRKHLQDEQIQGISAGQQRIDRWAGEERTDFS